jgi:hypothetical protein
MQSERGDRRVSGPALPYDNLGASSRYKENCYFRTDTGADMTGAELRHLIAAAKVQRDAAMARRIDAGNITNKDLLNELDQEIIECNKLIAQMEETLKRFEQ